MKSISLKIIPLCCLLGLLCSSCSKDVNEVKAMVFSAEVYRAGSKEVFTINGASQKGNVLEISGSYTGGCIDQEPDLVWGFEMGESLPPFTPIKLVLQNVDNCDKQVSKTWRFDLAELFRIAQADELSLSIEGLNSGMIKVTKK
jgi:hypothetical protein